MPCCYYDRDRDGDGDARIVVQHSRVRVAGVWLLNSGFRVHCIAVLPPGLPLAVSCWVTGPCWTNAASQGQGQFCRSGVGAFLCLASRA